MVNFVKFDEEDFFENYHLDPIIVNLDNIDVIDKRPTGCCVYVGNHEIRLKLKPEQVIHRIKVSNTNIYKNLES